ncbi:MAG: lytic murein transglycosylase B [Pseudomonadota bacterium]|nr:lytic murein transglycosylase B [Gammaproteobacteria bacterium]MBU1927127.1 lytic murein transglycosylase B [Gammaproteobacteria bacterium]MBU2545909.1 lytic murein transglycosylase B [Gammaproteobacteria bacterium]
MYLKVFVGFITVLFCSQIWATPTQPFGERKDVQAFIQQMVARDHFDREKLTSLFNTVKPRPKIYIKLDHPKEAEPWFQYKQIFLNKQRIEDGVAFWHQHKKTLEKAEKMYGVPPQIIVSIIGIESDFGTQLGTFKVLDSLSDIAFNYPKRTRFFRSELRDFLLFCRRWKLDPTIVLGSYAGAIGEAQFMPSSMLAYAIKFDHKKDTSILNDQDDVIGSIANFLNHYGWIAGQPMMMRAKISKTQKLKIKANQHEPTFSMEQLKKNGITPLETLPKNSLFGLLELQEKSGNEYWIGLNNFYVTTRYNSHLLYVVATYQLSQAMEKEYRRTYPE